MPRAKPSLRAARSVMLRQIFAATGPKIRVVAVLRARCPSPGRFSTYASHGSQPVAIVDSQHAFFRRKFRMSISCNHGSNRAAGGGVARQRRRGVVAVEAAFVLPILLTLLFGIWEAGRLVQVWTLVNDAAREGARLAAGGTNNGSSVTVSNVQQAVRDYMTAAGLPSTAVNGATITLTNLSSHTWTDPSGAQPLDPFTVAVTIPSGSAFNSLMWTSFLTSITGISQITTTIEWLSANDSEVTVSTSLPY